jgi:hypothetical protein
VTRNLVIDKGADFGPLSIFVVDAAGDPVNLAGWAVYAHARKKPSAAIAFDLAPTIADEAGGEIQIAPVAATTATWAENTYRWDILLQTPAGVRLPYLANSTVTVRGMATQPA